MDVIGTINNAISIVRRLREISKSIAEAEFRNLLADLSNDLADAKLEVAELKEQVAALSEENQALKKARPENREEPSGFRWGCYQFKDDDGLYCSACYDTKGQKIRTVRLRGGDRECPVCKARLR